MASRIQEQNPRDKLVSLQDALRLLRSSTFKIRIERNHQGDWEWGTGFFISRVDGTVDGTALTVYHNLPELVRKNKKGLLDAFYRGSWYQFECLVAFSSPENQGDIAVLRLYHPPPGLIEGLPIAYFDPSLPEHQRIQFWAGKPVCAFGFPCEQRGLGERFVDGNIDAGQPLVKIDLPDAYGYNIITTVERLRFLSLRAKELRCISGAPILDRETGLVVGVEDSYEESLSVVYGSEIAWLVKTWPELGKYAKKLGERQRPAPTQQITPQSQRDHCDHELLLQFWEHFITQETTIIFGSPVPDPDSLRYDPAGTMGVQDARAMEMILNTLRALAGERRLPIRFKSLPSVGIHGENLRDNLILIGGPYSNTVTADVLRGMPITLIFFGAGDIRAIYDEFDKKLYESNLKTVEGITEGVDWGIIIRTRSPFNPEKQVLVLAGRYGFGSYAAAEAVCTPSLLRVMCDQQRIFFKALVKAQVVRGWPQAAEVVTYKDMAPLAGLSESNRQAAVQELRRLLLAKSSYRKQHPDMVEIVWFGRGGQGLRTVSEILARAARRQGLFAQAFPEYGPERSGAPAKAYNRIARQEISVHCAVYEPDVVVVLDPSLLHSAVVGDILGVLQPYSTLVLNIQAEPQEIRQQAGHPGKIITVDAESIARETCCPFPNIPLLGAVLRAVDLVSLNQAKIELVQLFPEQKAELYCMALELGYERAVIS